MPKEQSPPPSGLCRFWAAITKPSHLGQHSGGLPTATATLRLQVGQQQQHSTWREHGQLPGDSAAGEGIDEQRQAIVA